MLIVRERRDIPGLMLLPFLFLSFLSFLFLHHTLKVASILRAPRIVIRREV
jgi:hypothetical protein